MKIRTFSPAKASAFTMVEIAISIAVIGFALVAIIGILPTGLNVQKDNLEDSIINQDGSYFIEAIRNGAEGLDELTNHVQTIGIWEMKNDPPGGKFAKVFELGDLKSGRDIVGLLSYPSSQHKDGSSFQARAYVRAVSGVAVEKGLERIDFNNSTPTADIGFGFGYLLVVSSRPFAAVTSPEMAAGEEQALESRLHELRLDFRWPLLPNGQTGSGRKVFRTLISGQVETNMAAFGEPIYFFRSR